MINNITLQKEQKEFLQTLLTMDEIRVLMLHPNDKSIILSVVNHGWYTPDIQNDLNRLRTRWSQPRPKANSNEFY